MDPFVRQLGAFVSIGRRSARQFAGAPQLHPCHSQNARCSRRKYFPSRYLSCAIGAFRGMIIVIGSTTMCVRNSVKSILVLEVKTIGETLWVRVDCLGERDETRRFEETIEDIRRRYEVPDDADLEDQRRSKLILDDYERLFEVKNEFAVFHGLIREAVLAPLAYREATFECSDGVVLRVEIKGHPTKTGHYLVRYYRDYPDDVDVEAIESGERGLVLTSTDDRFYRPVFVTETDVYAPHLRELKGHDDVRRAFDDLGLRITSSILDGLRAA
jgi:hypothetical protein